jgi:hypothetical protein
MVDALVLDGNVPALGLTYYLLWRKGWMTTVEPLQMDAPERAAGITGEEGGGAVSLK